MPKTESPLRYPGGKTKMYEKVRQIINDNMNLKDRVYVEPYAGGAGLALKLLYRGDVHRLILNDFDYHIYCFWYACLQETDRLCEMIRNCSISINEWNIQKEIYENIENYSVLEVAFATFFLNRCNVSGIIKGGPIGGIEQAGKYKIDARFNKSNLIEKIQKVAIYRDVIELYNMDAIFFLDNVVTQTGSSNIFLNIDPPYVKKGPMLYKNSYSEIDHKEIAERITKLTSKWMVTYDKCDLIKELYCNFRMDEMKLSYSAGNSKVGKEYIIYSDLIKLL